MNTLYADIIVDISHEKLDRTFQYRVPESLRGRLEPGACVMIPFGNGNRLIKGYVVALGETCQFAPEKIKDIAGMPEKETGVEDKMIALAAWIRRNYGCTMIQALKTVLPAKQSVKKLEHRQLVRLMNREEILSLLGECERKKQVAKARLLKALSEQETIPYEWITGKLGVSAATVNSIVKSGAAKLVSSESYRNPVKMQSVEAVRNTLSEEQQTIVTEVLADFDAGRMERKIVCTWEAPRAREEDLIPAGTARMEVSLILITVGRIMIASTITADSRFAPPVNWCVVDPWKISLSNLYMRGFSK